MGNDPRRTRQRGRRRHSRLVPCLVLAIGAALSSCASQEYWSFGATRAVYGDCDWDGPVPVSSDCGNEWGILALLLLPVAIDVVLLPVTLPHDFMAG